MTIRNLDKLFRPHSVALIGASRRAGSVGAVTARNLVSGGFAGPVWLVNPNGGEIAGHPVYDSIAALPAAPDLAVIATPAAAVPTVVAKLAARGTRGAVVIGAGFAETGADGAARQLALCEAARPHLLRIVGPNCLGILAPAVGLNASFAHMHAKPGDLAFVAQSGAVLAAVLDWAAPRELGFSHLVSLGNKADVDFGDMLDWLALDEGTRAILLYVESINHPRKFMSAARAAARVKPVLVIKAGRHAATARAVASHTGAMAGADAVYEAAFRRAGLLRVRDLAELFDAVETLALARRVAGDRLAILTNGGGMGILAADALVDYGASLADLAPDTIARLNSVLPPSWSRGNPVDIIGDADGARYAAALEAVLDDPNADAVLVLNCPTAITSGEEAARAVAGVANRIERPVLTSWVGAATAARARAIFQEAGLPTYETPGEAVRGFAHLARHRRSRELLMETPPSLPAGFSVDAAAARRLIAAAMAEDRAWLMEHEAKAVLAAYGIPVVETRLADDEDAAGALARALGPPVALKIVSPDILHKSDVGGVVLGLETPRAVRAAAWAMRARVRERLPEARIAGFAVQRMAVRAGAFELIAGMTSDAQFGPVILFGHGGTGTEIIGDTALALPPLNLGLAHELMARTRIHALLRGYRGRPPAALDEIALSLVRLSQLVIDQAEVAELDVNPLLADADGVIALDARIRVAAPERPGVARLAIRPYPRELETTVAVRSGERFRLRPVRPEDEPALARTIAMMSPEALRMRFLAAVRQLPHVALARLTQLDYDREMAILAVPEDPARDEEIFAVARFAAEPDGQRAEYAIAVRTDMTGRGLALTAMRHLIDYARRRGIGELHGAVLRENIAMIRLAQKLGMTIEPDPDDLTLVQTRLKL